MCCQKKTKAHGSLNVAGVLCRDLPGQEAWGKSRDRSGGGRAEDLPSALLSPFGTFGCFLDLLGLVRSVCSFLWPD